MNAVSNACDAAPCPEFEYTLFKACEGITIDSPPEVGDRKVGSDLDAAVLFHKSQSVISRESRNILPSVYLIQLFKNEHIRFTLMSSKNQCAPILVKTEVAITRM